MTDKKAILLNACGGMFGMDIIDEIVIEGHNAQGIINEDSEKVKASAQRLAELALQTQY